MNRNQILAAVASAGISAAGAMAQDAVQWRVEDGGNGHWYRRIVPPTRLDVGSALQRCIAAGGNLASIASAAENAFVFELARQDPSLWTLAWPGATQITGPWIGAIFSAPSWQWSDGTSWSFTAWSPGNPNYMQEEHAVLFMGVAGGAPTSQWNNIQPTYLNWGYMVEWSADCNGDGIVDYGQCRDGSLPDFNGNNIPDCCEQGVSCVVSDYPIQWRTQDGGNGHWYQLRPKVGDWFACRAVAQALSGDLASPSTQAENSLVERIVPPKQFPIWNRVFLGGRQSPNSTPNEGWYWVDGSDWTYTDWYINQPDGGEPFLVAMPDENGCTWGDYPSNSSDIYYFIIEWSADCNGDGFVDYGQILAGQLQDSNGNGIPDECELPCLADIDGNGDVNGIDLAIILDKWGTDGGKDYPNADIDGDGTVAGPDLSQVLSGWGPCQ